MLAFAALLSPLRSALGPGLFAFALAAGVAVLARRRRAQLALVAIVFDAGLAELGVGDAGAAVAVAALAIIVFAAGAAGVDLTREAALAYVLGLVAIEARGAPHAGLVASAAGFVLFGQGIPRLKPLFRDVF